MDRMHALCYHLRDYILRKESIIMATVTIRNLDDAVVERLKARAKLQNRSLEAELREVLSRIAADVPAYDRTLVARRVKAMGGAAQFEDSTALIREDRDR